MRIGIGYLEPLVHLFLCNVINNADSKQINGRWQMFYDAICNIICCFPYVADRIQSFLLNGYAEMFLVCISDTQNKRKKD